MLGKALCGLDNCRRRLTWSCSPQVFADEVVHDEVIAATYTSLAGTPEGKGNFKKLHKQLQEIHAALDSHIINCNGTTDEIKDILLECAAVVKAVNDLQTEE